MPFYAFYYILRYTLLKIKPNINVFRIRIVINHLYYKANDINTLPKFLIIESLEPKIGDHEWFL